MERITENCQVEWDINRGVLYVHNSLGQTIIRISNVPRMYRRMNELGHLNLIDIRAYTTEGDAA